MAKTGIGIWNNNCDPDPDSGSGLTRVFLNWKFSFSTYNAQFNLKISICAVEIGTDSNSHRRIIYSDSVLGINGFRRD